MLKLPLADSGSLASNDIFLTDSELQILLDDLDEDF